jgi:hypothetical protein
VDRPTGVSSGISLFWNTVRFPALWGASLVRSLLILFDHARRCNSVRLVPPHQESVALPTELSAHVKNSSCEANKSYDIRIELSGV